MKPTKIILIAFICAIFTLVAFTSNDRKLIVIDAGHGGHDFGAVNADHREKDIVRRIADQIVHMNFDMTLEFGVIGEEDKFVDLEERVKAINSLNPNVLVSLHVNASKNSNDRGTEIIISRKNKDYKKSKEIAEKLLKKFPEESGAKNKIVETDLYVLKNAKCPAITVEVGYISNNTDLQNMTSEVGQRAIAEKIIKSIVE